MWYIILSVDNHDAVCQQCLQWNNNKKYCALFRDGEKGGKLETLRQTAKNFKKQINIYIHTYI